MLPLWEMGRGVRNGLAVEDCETVDVKLVWRGAAAAGHVDGV